MFPHGVSVYAPNPSRIETHDCSVCHLGDVRGSVIDIMLDVRNGRLESVGRLSAPFLDQRHVLPVL